MKSLWTILLAINLIVFPCYSQKKLIEQDLTRKTLKVRGKKFKPTAPKPVFEGAFSVGMVLIDFPDTQIASLDEIKASLFHFGPMTIMEYFKEYSQNKAWPQMMVIGEERFPKSVYLAPQPFGYYCEHDYWGNPIGFKGMAEGKKRANTLRSAALKHAFRFYKKPAKDKGIKLKSNGKPDVVCYGFTTKLKEPEGFKKLIEPYYKDHKVTEGIKKEAYEFYKPKVPWGDPLWPNSLPQVFLEGGGGTLCHELGHVIGAPDFYHAPEINDGTPGVPCLAWAYGPTGPAYCRFIYNGFLQKENYPVLTKSGTYKLYPRMTNPAGDKPVGYFIPSQHSHYIYYLEYVKGEKAPLGNPGEVGMLIHVINRTLTSPLLGAPDLCYTYRPNDPWFRSEGNLDHALFGNASGRTSFSSETEPSSRLPNLLDGGIAIDEIKETDEGVSFKLEVVYKGALSKKDYVNSLIPKIQLEDVVEVLPTSIRAICNVTYRGEPLNTEYGFCWSTRKNPKISSSSSKKKRLGTFPLYHRDRYSGRILNLKPETKYYVRAYIKNAIGISYSEKEMIVETPPLDKGFDRVEPLLEDRFSGNWTIDTYYGFRYNKDGFFVGSTAVTTLMKLTGYYRSPYVVKSPTIVSRSKKSRKSGRVLRSSKQKAVRPKSVIDYTRVHFDPSLSKPPKRMVEYYDMMDECNDIAKKTRMHENEFSKDFDLKFARAYGLIADKKSKLKVIEELNKDTIETLSPHIKESIKRGVPVVVVQESFQMSPRSHAFNWIIIDGYDENGNFHLDFPRGKDRDFKTKTGWYKLEALLREVELAKVIFNFKPAGIL